MAYFDSLHIKTPHPILFYNPNFQTQKVWTVEQSTLAPFRPKLFTEGDLRNIHAEWFQHMEARKFSTGKFYIFWNFAVAPVDCKKLYRYMLRIRFPCS